MFSPIGQVKYNVVLLEWVLHNINTEQEVSLKIYILISVTKNFTNSMQTFYFTQIVCFL